MPAAATPNPPRSLIDAKEFARRLSVSERFIYKMVAKGALPKPVKIGAATRWSTKVIDEWVNAGCPTKTSSE